MKLVQGMSLHRQVVLRDETHLVCRLHFQQRQWWKPTRYFWIFATIVAHYYQKRWQRRWEDMLTGENVHKARHDKIFEAQKEFFEHAKASGEPMLDLMASPEGVKAPDPGEDYVMSQDVKHDLKRYWNNIQAQDIKFAEIRRLSRQEEDHPRSRVPSPPKTSPVEPTS
jgi:hypothetical protein